MPTDEELLAAADADPEAFAALYRRHAAPLLRFCTRRTGDPDAGADAVAETFARALEGCHRYRADRGPAAGWLYGIARHVLARHATAGAVELAALRRLRLERPPLDAATRDLAQGSDAEAALESLPAHQREAVRARVLDDRAYAEIAAGSGTTEAATRQHVSRGLRALRRRLSTPEDPR